MHMFRYQCFMLIVLGHGESFTKSYEADSDDSCSSAQTSMIIGQPRVQLECRTIIHNQELLAHENYINYILHAFA